MADDWSASDCEMMDRALALARAQRNFARPNPSVGCVITKNGVIVGEGATSPAGGAHAEINALDEAGAKAAGAALYVTLEPCAHEGRNPPCTTALIDAGIAEVVYACPDPNPRVDGAGAAALQAAGIETRSGLRADDAEDLIRGFSVRMRYGRPRVTLKAGMSLDGATAMASGESQWITGRQARDAVQALRAASGAIVTGAGTVVADNPSLTVRDPAWQELPTRPFRAVLDSGLRTPADADIYDDAAPTRLYCRDDEAAGPYWRRGVTVVTVPAASDGRIDPGAVLADLAAEEVNDVLLECGPVLAGAFAIAGLIDEYRLFVAPRLLGSSTRRLLETPSLERLEDGLDLDIVALDAAGRDLVVTARPRQTDA